jgi:uncharacterized protein YuzE
MAMSLLLRPSTEVRKDRHNQQASISLKVTYRRGQPIAAYVCLQREEDDRVATTERLDAAVLVDRAADSRVIGIAIVDPSQCGPDRLMDVLRSLGHGEVDRDEFRPLAAA